MPDDVNAVLDQIEAQQAFELAPNATSLTLLQKVYRSPALALMTRVRASIAALPFEHPKLAVVATINSGDFADQLDQAVKRSKVIIEAKPMIEAKPSSDGDTKPAPVSIVDGHKPSILDRRFRRW